MKYSITRPGYNDAAQHMVAAIKSIRSLFPFSLKEAKDLVESARQTPMIPIVFECLEKIDMDAFNKGVVDLETAGYLFKSITSSQQIELRASLEANAKMAIDLDNIQLAIDLLKLRQAHF